MKCIWYQRIQKSAFRRIRLSFDFLCVRSFFWHALHKFFEMQRTVLNTSRGEVESPPSGNHVHVEQKKSGTKLGSEYVVQEELAVLVSIRGNYAGNANLHFGWHECRCQSRSRVSRRHWRELKASARCRSCIRFRATIIFIIRIILYLSILNVEIVYIKNIRTRAIYLHLYLLSSFIYLTIYMSS